MKGNRSRSVFFQGDGRGVLHDRGQNVEHLVWPEGDYAVSAWREATENHAAVLARKLVLPSEWVVRRVVL